MSFKPIPQKKSPDARGKTEKRSWAHLFSTSRFTSHSSLLGATGPALLLFSGAAFLWQTPLPQPLGVETEHISGRNFFAEGGFSERNWIVPASQTLFVSQQTTGKHITVQGLLEASNQNEVKSPTSGEVAKLLVENGQYVTEGQEIAVLTTGVAPPAAGSAEASPLDQWQQRAENEQLAAAKEQEKLETQAKAANTELTRAQARVVAAQRRVADARQLIARLKEGEEIYKSDLNGQSGEKPASRVASATDSPAKLTLLKESQELQKTAEAAEMKAKTAEKAVRAADALVEASQQKLQTALSKEKEKQNEKTALPDAGAEAPDKTSAPEEQAVSARSSGKSTLGAGSELTKNVADAKAQAAQARSERARLQTQATEARKRSNQAAQRLAQGLHLFDEEKADEEPKKPKSTGGEKLTLAEVARTARAAIRESNEAIADAERIQRKLAGHSQRIAQSHQRFEKSAQQLREAQQRIWENVPAMRTSQTPLTASQSGILTWTVKPLQILKPGERVAQIGRPDRLEVVVEDRSELWKTLQVDQQTVALVRRKESASPQKTTSSNASLIQASSPISSSNPSSSSASGFRPVAAELTPNSPGIGTPTSARVLAIAPPGESGGPARIRIAVHNPPQVEGNNQSGQSPRAFAPGMMAFFSLAQEPTQKTIRIPTAAVRHGEGGRTYVAVLLPLEKQGRAQTVDLCHVEWREVFLAPGDGQSNRVKTGLKEGERLVLRPNELYQFTLSYGEKATVGVEQI